MTEEFTPITTQEQFDSIIKDRINRLNEKHQKEISEMAEKYADYEDLKKGALSYNKTVDELNAKVSGYEAQLKEKDEKISAYELHSVKQQIALDAGIPLALADKLSGSNEEELRKDAENMASFVVKEPNRVAPMSQETANKAVDGVAAIFKQMNPNLKI